MAAKVQYPKWIYAKDGASKLVATPEAHEALETAQPGMWAESPEHFDEDGRPIVVPDPPANPVPVPGVDKGAGAPYPKWIYHPDGREKLLATKEEHEALVDKDAWQENKDFTAVAQSNSVAAAPHPGEALWDTSSADILQMISGTSLADLRKTRDLESENPAYKGGRRGLMRELDELIVAAEKAIADGA